FLDSRNGFVRREHTANRKEAGLHDRIDAIAKLFFFGHRVGINRINLDLFADDLFLDRKRKLLPNLLGWIRTVQQQRCSINGRSQDVIRVNKSELMNGNEVCPLDQIGAADGTVAKAKM